MSDEVFDLLTRGFAESFGAAEIDGVGLDQVGIELMLPDELAQAIADFGAVVSIYRLGRQLFRLPGWGGFGERPNLLDRADADPVSLAQGTVDRPSFRDPHLGATYQRRDIGRIGVA